MAVFEIVLVGKLDPQETPVGVAIALIATALAFGAAAAGEVRYAFRPSWLWLPLLVARNIVRDTFLVLGVVVRRLAGGRTRDAYREVPIDPGGDDPVSAARRALVVAAVSTSPNEIVLGIDARRRRMRVHVLVQTDAEPHSEQWPL